MEEAVQETWMPLAAGILNISAGVVFLLTLAFGAYRGIYLIQEKADNPIMTTGYFVFFIILLSMLDIPMFFGGVNALNRSKWGWALAGSITATLVVTVFGIPAIVFTAISRNEFDQQLRE
jgi:hypothetical protein